VSLRDTASSRQPEVVSTENLGSVEVGPDGGEFVDVKTTEPITDWTQIFERFQLDPNVFTIAGDTVRMSTWEQSKRLDNGERDVVRLYSYRASFVRSRDAIDLPALYAEARRKPRGRVKTAPTERATVIVLADPQIGKTGRRGGTPELLDRMAEKRELLAPILKARRPSRILLADAGDGFEGFNSGGNPMFTNDLSLAQQMDAYGTELYSFLELAHRFAPVDVAAVPSNHTAWRNGKQNLGNPQDDLGLFVHQQVAKVAHAAQLDATWHLPAPYDESVAVNLLGTVIGMAHGNQFGPGQSVSWWEKQTFGAQAIANADVLITGHYHSFSANVAGRNPANQRMRWSLGAPTLDNGSDWYRTKAGRDSDPGMLIFDVTLDGFDLASLAIL
jgi:hypothetical protein